MRKSNNNLKAHEEDSMDEILDKNDVLVDKLSKNSREIKRLKSENKTLRAAWEKAEKYIIMIAEKEYLDNPNENILDDDTLEKTIRCPSCKSKGAKNIGLGKFNILICNSCGYRKRFNEGKSSQNKKD